MNRLTIIIVNYNSTDYLERCLKSILKETCAGNYRIAVIDNASDEQNFSALKKLSDRIQFILNSRNVGFATACNQGIRALPASYYLFLNPDCVIEESAIDRTLDFLVSQPSAGIVGCRVNDPDGSLQPACRRKIPRPSTAFFRLFGLSRLFPQSRRISAYNMTYENSEQTHEVEAVSGSFLMFRHEILHDIGGMDEDFFLYGEDLDFCYRASLRGWKVFYYPHARVVHYKGRSSARARGISNYHFYKSMEIFYRKHFADQQNRVQRWMVLSGIKLLYAGRLLRTRLAGQ